jgi:hypothetical protein
MRFVAVSCVLFLLFFVVAASAAPPFQTSTATGTTLTVTYPKFSAYAAGQAGIMNFHVFDVNGTPLTNVTTNCTAHVYLPNGTHEVSQVLAYGSDEWELNMSASLMSRIGEHSLVVYCQKGAVLGGFFSGNFLVTYDGTDMTGQDALPAVLVALIPLLFAFIVLWGASLFDPEEHAALRIFSHVLSWVAVFGSLWMGTTVVIKFYNWSAFTDGVGTFGMVLGWLLFALAAYWIIYVFVKIIEAVKEKKESRMNA